MATYETIEAEIKVLYLLRPHLKTNTDQVKTMALLWLEDLVEVPDDVFIEAVKVVRKRTKFFPTTCEVLEAAREVEAARFRPQPLRLPAHDTQAAREEQQAKNVARARAFARRIGEGKRIQ